MSEPVVSGAAASSDSEPVPAGPAPAPEPRQTRASSAASEATSAPDDVGPSPKGAADDAADGDDRPRPRRRGSRGGRSRTRPADGDDEVRADSDGDGDGDHGSARSAAGPSDDPASDSGPPAPRRPAKKAAARKPTPPAETAGAAGDTDGGGDAGRSAEPDELPDLPKEGKARSAEAAERALVRKPRIGDTRPAPAAESADQNGSDDASDADADAEGARSGSRRRRGGRGRGAGGGEGGGDRPERGGRGGQAASGNPRTQSGSGGQPGQGGAGSRGQGGGRGRGPKPVPVQASMPDEPLELDEDDMARRRGRERKGRPVGRYLMCVSVGPKATQIAVLEGRNLIEHFVAHPADDISQIHGNIYIGKVQNVLPGMEAAFIDIGTPKNAVLYRGDVQYDAEDIEEKGQARIEQILKPKQTILCQVTKNPIAHKGARLTQEVSLPGRFVVLIPNSTTYGISKRLADDERKRLRNILDKVRPKGHGLIVRTAADGVTAEEIERDMLALSHQWEQIEALAAKTNAPALLYREPDMAVRVIREEFNQDYRGIMIDDPQLFNEVRSYVNAISPALADRVQLYDKTVEPLSIFERHHVHEQLHRALDRKVWLPSGGSLIIEHTEALTVIDVNTGKNVGSSNLEETVYRNNLEAAEEVAKQLRLRDIGGIIVIDFIDMEIEHNRREVIKTFRNALARDKTRTQVFDISDLGLVEMTRKRIGEGLLEGFTTSCPECEGRGLIIDQDLMI